MEVAHPRDSGAHEYAPTGEQPFQPQCHAVGLASTARHHQVGKVAETV